ncbi:competence type IV pilus minor pilin ComGG [Ectobacillus ponti]|uniref:ComGG family competence protein n=1 Tax=Ectobacillus ponti TaxID=2961894 RepID=A0AA41X818_9BACI|nr:competence type IV pilus minor pilin ComGG [Ectobacillus ponti]MCP8967096.1 ComGG family competence protein [Ectobacillus ponti]
MKEERGAVLPAVLLFSLIFLSLFLHNWQVVRVEKQFQFEAEQYLLLDQLMANAVQEAKRALQQGTALPPAGQYEDETGKARISYQLSSASVIKVSIFCSTTRNRAYQASFLYNKEHAKLSKWAEERFN